MVMVVVVAKSGPRRISWTCDEEEEDGVREERDGGRWKGKERTAASVSRSIWKKEKKEKTTRGQDLIFAVCRSKSHSLLRSPHQARVSSTS